jgi:Fe2+ transport system protein FeoA
MIRRLPTPAEELIPLRLLARGQSAEIGELIGQPDQVQRLRELGLRSGAQIEMVQPGSPCIVRLEAQRICFRESDLIGILVRRSEPQFAPNPNLTVRQFESTPVR